MYHIRQAIVAFVATMIVSLIGSVIYPAYQANAADWGSASNEIQLVSKVEVSQSSLSYCRYGYQLRAIHGEDEQQNVCIDDSSGGVVIGLYVKQGRSYFVAGSLHDRLLYHFSGCERADSCLYVPSQDVLFIKYGTNYLYARSMVMYKNVSQRLEKTYDAASGETHYKVSGEKDYSLRANDGTAWWMYGWAVSDNGRWLVVELRERGFAVLDIETMQLKWVSKKILDYGHGSDATPELAISNDGSAIAITGSNAGESLLLNKNDCGDYPTDAELSLNVALQFPCVERQIPAYAVNTNYYQMHLPRFDDSGAQLSVYAVTRNGEYYHEVFRAPGYSSPTILYLSMGDSFTSGEGEVSDQYYQQNTNTTYEKCHTSSRSYSYLVGAMMDLGDQAVKNVACSGARISDMTGSEVDYWGQSDRLADPSLGLDFGQRMSQQQVALLNFIPGRIHQDKFVDWYHPQLITVGVGGNDAALLGKLKTCLMLDVCEWAASQDKIAQTRDEIEALRGRLTAMYQKIQQQSPASKLYSVGYPQIISDQESCDTLGVLLDHTERTFMRQSIDLLNATIQKAAQDANVRYVDVADVLDGHQLCQDGTAINMLRLGDDITVSKHLAWLKLIGNESFHPTPFGHELLSKRIYDQLTADITNTAPQYDADYWIGNALSPYQSSVEMLSDTSLQAGSSLVISLSAGRLQPNSAVEVSLHSVPRMLSGGVAGSDGSLHLTTTIPLDVEPGFHTVHVTGLSYSGEPIDFYQELFYTTIEQDITDIDTDGEIPQPIPTDATTDEDDSTPSVSTTPEPSIDKQPPLGNIVSEEGTIAVNVPVGNKKSHSGNQVDQEEVLAAIDTGNQGFAAVGDNRQLTWVIVGLVSLTTIIASLILFRRWSN